uniref:Gem-associated protein 4 isoform X2 n=1 Tax=Geotrypetes seraphini TaxID=260995 RepID=A0A6P8NMZ6_GEOSA|nr:gem-associated protein 4 isoform X2 [Geotrypetes seraphini]XP_033777507.1 gem-associated protein 4 isoform X2 [Geotrypetes seraphini]XP_033777508.1 gem-associated protein 4 isoform X2 [Geotrypetes seraphini]
MDLGPWNVCGQMTILQGGFLLAEKSCCPKILKEIKKPDWALVGQPITAALKEIDTVWDFQAPQPQNRDWTKRALAIIWTKILTSRSKIGATEVEKKWKEDISFSVGRMIPSINHVVLFELLKTLKLSKIFVELLLALPPSLCYEELTLFVEYVTSETSVEDITTFLDTWWAIMKHSEQKDETTSIFSIVASQYVATSSDEFCQSPKRFKYDPDCLQTFAPGSSILMVLLDGLNQMKGDIASSKLKCFALANLAEMLSVCALLDKDSELVPIEIYLEKLATVISVWKSDKKAQCHQDSLAAKVKEAEINLCAATVASGLKLLQESRYQGFRILKDLLLHWGDECTLVTASYESYRMRESLAFLVQNLNCFMETGSMCRDERETVEELRPRILSILEKIMKLDVTVGQSTMVSIAVIIIKDRLIRHKEMCSLFASQRSWAFSVDWVDCLDENRALFQEPELVLKLLETIMSSVFPDDMPEIKRTTEMLLNCFSELSLPDKNRVLLGVLSTVGRKGLSQKLKMFTTGFQEELNTAFNQIAQSGSDQGLTKAASNVARLALLNPEATLKKACHFAILNVGAHRFLAQILNSLPALSIKDTQNLKGTTPLLIECLKEVCWGKLSSASEESQFLAFLTSFMESSEHQHSSPPLLLPADVIRAFVLPYLVGNFVNIQLSLQILQRALNVQKCINGTGNHWVMSCSPFPLILSLCKLINGYTKYWQHSEASCYLTMESKDLIIDILVQLCEVVLLESQAFPESWTKSLFWLHRKMEHLDWTVCLRLKTVFGNHFKNEVPAHLFEVSRLSEDEWMPLQLGEYGPGTGLLAWLECCCVSQLMKDQMLSFLAVDTGSPEVINLFSKGFLVALIQVLPWCSPGEWKLLAGVVQSLLQRKFLHVPYSLEYVQFMPLLNLRPFTYDLQFSVLLLRGFQLLCSASCSDWLPLEGWKHVARLYCSSIAEILESVKSRTSDQDLQERDYVQEALFVYIQVFCHLLHIIAMMPNDSCEPLYFLSLEVLTLYETTAGADTTVNNLLRRTNEQHFLQSVAESVSNEEQRSTLLQKIGKFK